MVMLFSNRNILYLLIICLLAIDGVGCVAQYRPQYSQYMFNGLAINPAYAGSQDALNIAALYRSSQWGSSVVGAPVTQTFAGDFPLHNQQLALGLMVFNDKINIIRNSGAYFSYAFRINAGAGKLSFGLQAGFDLQHEDHTKLILANPVPEDPMFSLENAYSMFMPNVGVGTYYYTPKFFVGISLPQLLKYSPQTAKSNDFKLTLANTMLYGGTIISAGKDFKIKPTTLLQYAYTGFLWDVSCNFLLLKEILELGLSWRNIGVLVAMAQIKINKVSIGYAYDYALGKPSAINTTHEIMLRYDLNFKIKAISPLHL